MKEIPEPTWRTASIFGVPEKERHGPFIVCPEDDHKVVLGLKQLPYEERLRELRFLNPKAPVGTYFSTSTYKESLYGRWREIFLTRPVVTGQKAMVLN